MKLSMKVAAISLCLLMAAAFARAQDQPKTSDDHSPDITQLRVDVLLTEYAGEKKLNSLPYTLYVGASDYPHGLHATNAFLRMGVRVPILVGDEKIAANYTNVGTNIDCDAASVSQDTYRLQLTVNRTAIYSPDSEVTAGEPFHVGGQPILRDFESRFELSLHDGQSGEGLSATDPFNGHLLKVTVILHVQK